MNPPPVFGSGCAYLSPGFWVGRITEVSNFFSDIMLVPFGTLRNRHNKDYFFYLWEERINNKNNVVVISSEVKNVLQVNYGRFN